MDLNRITSEPLPNLKPVLYFCNDCRCYIRFPSAVAAMQSGSRSIPIVVIGGGQSVDCAPAESNYTRFYDAAKSVALEVVLNEAGHFQFLDDQNTLQKSVCVQGLSTVFVFGTHALSLQSFLFGKWLHCYQGFLQFSMM